MASICVHRAPRTPLDIAPGHIRSRGDLLEDHRPATDLPHTALTALRARLVPGPTLSSNSSGTAIAIPRALGHISSRDGLQEARRPDTDLPHKAVRARLVPSPPLFCNSSGTAMAIPRASRAHQLARWFAGRTPTCHRAATHGRQGPVSAQPSALLQFIWHGNRHSTGLQDTSTRAMASICVHRAPRTPPDSAPRHIGSLDVLQEDRRRSPTCQKICQEDLVGLKNSTIEKKLGYLRWFLNWPTDRGYNTNLDYKKFHPTLKMTQRKVIYLT